MSPFISVSRLRGSGRVTALGVVVAVAVLGIVVPASGGPKATSSATAKKTASKALKTARSASRKASSAKRTAASALKIAKAAPADNSVTTAKIRDFNVGNADLAPGAVGTGKIMNGSIRTEDLGDGVVNSAKLLNASVTTADLNVSDVTGTIDLTEGFAAAESCNTSTISIPGARVGDLPLMAFVGGVSVPAGLTIQVVKISASDQGNLRVCNVAETPSPAVSGLGVRIISFH